MYALKARIRNRSELDDLKVEHSHLTTKVDQLIDLLRHEVDDSTQSKILAALGKGVPSKRARN